MNAPALLPSLCLPVTQANVSGKEVPLILSPLVCGFSRSDFSVRYLEPVKPHLAVGEASSRGSDPLPGAVGEPPADRQPPRRRRLRPKPERLVCILRFSSHVSGFQCRKSWNRYIASKVFLLPLLFLLLLLLLLLLLIDTTSICLSSPYHRRQLSHPPQILRQGVLGPTSRSR